jgi:acyl-CoA thioesterase-2
MWFRAAAPLPDDGVLSDCLMLYVSDYGTPWHAAAPAGLDVGPSLDHSVWFRRRSRLDEWHHIRHEPMALSDARGLYVGQVWRADGTQVLTVAQENLIRPKAG